MDAAHGPPDDDDVEGGPIGDDDDFDDDDPRRCVSCGRLLTEREISRYEHELEEWYRKHDPDYELDDLDEPGPPSVQKDCDGCAVERLRLWKRIAENETLSERILRGKGCGAVTIAVMLILLFAALANK